MRPWRTARGAARYFAIEKLQCGHGHEAVENSWAG